MVHEVSPPPKYRGDSEDWLDEEDTTFRNKSKSRPTTLTKEAAQRALKTFQLAPNATVIEVFPFQCSVEIDISKKTISCVYRKTAVYLREAAKSQVSRWKERAPVAVGDRVRVKEMAPDEGVIEGVSERKTRIVRPAPDRGKETLHVIATNVDKLCIVTSAVNPEFSPGLVDRFLIAAQVEGIEPILCINKMDNYPENQIPKPWDFYRELGVKTFEVSVKQKIGIEELKQELMDQQVAFCGHSGVGKTSLLSLLLGQEIGKIGRVNSFTGKGKHTTSSAVMLRGVGNTRWIDTPGVREFGLIGVKSSGLASFFPEFHGLECQVLGCRHVDEVGCQAQGLKRYTSYLRIYQSLLEGELL